MSMKVAQTLWRGKADHNAAWQISNGVIRLVVTKLGGCVVMYLPHSHFFFQWLIHTCSAPCNNML